MKIRRARNFRHGRIEIIPMIDVMFFLLVTFMLASLSMQSLNSIAVNLPKGDAESLQHLGAFVGRVGNVTQCYSLSAFVKSSYSAAVSRLSTSPAFDILIRIIQASP